MNGELTIEQKIDMISDFQVQLDLFSADKKAAIDEVLKPVKKELDEIEEEFSMAFTIANENIALLKSEVEAEVLKIGETQRGTFQMACFTKGRSGGFDTKMLDGMSKLIPQINEARKPDGQPSVSWRQIGK
jgi:hypothetical protein